MRAKQRLGIRELILKAGIRPHVVDGVWDGYTMVDDGTGRLHAWLDRQGARVPPDGIRRTALQGPMEREARRMAAEGFWGEIHRSG